MKIRNIAIIAHVDHGKTTLVDQLLKQGEQGAREKITERSMDSDQIEKERGITILSKVTSVQYQDHKINVLDTPGHADFGGEVERIMTLVDGVLLLVDAYEGVMPQTKFVLKQALDANILPILVINKLDREFANPSRVLDQVYDLFIDLGATEAQLNFPVLYASGINGLAGMTSDLSKVTNLDALFQTVIKYIPTPKVSEKGDLLFQPALIDYNDYVGRMGVGKIHQGVMKENQMVDVLRHNQEKTSFRIQKIYEYIGLHKQELAVAYAGDIVAIAGLEDITVGETIATPGTTTRITPLKISPPTVQMTFGINTSPLAGKEGAHVTSNKIFERLTKEAKKDVSLAVNKIANEDDFVVHARGELHLGILIENMRREGYEFQVSRPQVLYREVNGKVLEPFEEATIDCPTDTLGGVMELLGKSGAILDKMETMGKDTRLIYSIPSRGLIGLMTQFLTTTRGYGTISHVFLEYRPKESDINLKRKNGVLFAVSEGNTTSYALQRLESRGVMFVEPRTYVYEGMIVGENNQENDLGVNVVQAKQLTNVRAASKDTTVVLKRPRVMGLEECLDFINDDELIEVTPQNIRLRKRYLKAHERKRAKN